MMKYIYLLIFSLMFQCVFAQTGGENLYAFLNTPTSPKQIALGGVTLTSTDDVSQTLWNPAILNSKIEGDLAVNYINYISDISVGSLSYAKTIHPKYGMAFFGVQYFNYGDLERTEATGPTVLGTFSARDLAVNLGYAYTYEMVTFGLTLKYISSKIDVFTSSALLYDIGIRYQDPNSSLQISAVIRNSGQQITPFMDQEETVNANAILSASYQLEHVPLKFYASVDEINRWNISVANPTNASVDLDGNTTEEEISQAANALRHLSGGVELWPEKKISLRLGYNHRRSQEFQLDQIRTRSGLTYGFGLNTKRIKFDYAFAKFQEGAKFNTFGLTIHFNK